LTFVSIGGLGYAVADALAGVGEAVKKFYLFEPDGDIDFFNGSLL